MATLTSRLGGLLRRMRLPRPASIDLHRDAPAPARRPAPVLPRLTHRMADPNEAPTDIDPEPLDPTPVPGVAPPAKRTGLLWFLPGAKRDAAIAQLQHDYAEVMGLIRDVRRHLDGQADRSDQMLDLLTGLPAALQSLPESNRNQQRMLEALNEHLGRSHQQASQLTASIRGLATATEHQAQTLGVLQDQLTAGRETDEHMLRSFSAMTSTLDNINDTTRHSTATLRAVADQSASSEQHLASLIAQNGRQTLWVAAMCVALAATALGVAIAVAM